MLSETSGSHRMGRRKYSSSSKRRSVFLLFLLPSALLILVWLRLYRQLAITSSSSTITAQVISPQRLHLQSNNNELLIPPLPHIVDNTPLVETTSKQINVKKRDKIVITPKRSKRRKVVKPDHTQHEQQQQQRQQQHHHVIPNIITFTHVINLLTTTTTLVSNVTTADEQEHVALQTNVRNTIKLHPGAEVRFFTNSECISSIQRVMGEDSPLVQFFEQEAQGMFKADICRGAALYETGGLYFDVDLQARMSMWNVISPSTEFVVPLVHAQSKHVGAFFQAFIGITPRHALLKKYLLLFIEYYQGKLFGEEEIKGGPLGVLLLRKAYDLLIMEEEEEEEEDATSIKSSNIELWQEVLYNSRLFPNVAPPSWGTRRACHFVVVANSKPPFIVPLYSRVKGSRMCGGKESHQKQLRGG